MMTTPDEIDIKRWAFRVRPETEQNETGWRAWYPGTDWSVSAPTEDEARKLLQTEAERRRQAGQDPFTDIYRSTPVHKGKFRDTSPLSGAPAPAGYRRADASADQHRQPHQVRDHREQSTIGGHACCRAADPIQH